MSLVELKQIAKDRRIKQYYIMKRAQLIQLLSMKELPEALRVEKMTIHELRDEAKRRGLRGFWPMRRGRLVDLLFPEHHVHEATSDQNKQNESHTDEHDDPQKHDAEHVGVDELEDGDYHRLDNISLEGVL